jgi:hypothetical protein
MRFISSPVKLRIHSCIIASGVHMKTAILRVFCVIFCIAFLLGSQSDAFASSSHVTGGSITASPTPPPASESDQALSPAFIPPSSCDANGNCTVSSVGDWLSTPITLQANQVYQTAYLTGTWTVDKTKYAAVGPEGYDTSTDTAIGFWSYCKYAMDLPYGTLLGKIGTTGDVIPIGRGGSFTAPADGNLFLRINDVNNCQVDNDGFVNVNVSALNNPPEDIPAWTLIYYYAGDSDNRTDYAMTTEFDSAYNRSIQPGRNPNINLAFFYDGYTSKARYQYVRWNGDTQTIEKDELNTGDPSTLSDFVLWAKNEIGRAHV